MMRDDMMLTPGCKGRPVMRPSYRVIDRPVVRTRLAQRNNRADPLMIPIDYAPHLPSQRSNWWCVWQPCGFDPARAYAAWLPEKRTGHHLSALYWCGVSALLGCFAGFLTRFL